MVVEKFGVEPENLVVQIFHYNGSYGYKILDVVGAQKEVISSNKGFFRKEECYADMYNTLEGKIGKNWYKTDLD